MLKMCANLSVEASSVFLQTLSPNPQAILLFLSSENCLSLVHNAPVSKLIFFLLNEQVRNPINQKDGGPRLMLIHLMRPMVKIKRPQLKLFFTLTL
jgi:hypothetical protein